MKAKQKKFTQHRIVFLSFVPDRDQLAMPCYRHFRERLKPIRCDDSGIPLESMSSEELLKAGDVKAVVDEKLHDVTDLVALLSSQYLDADEKAEKERKFAFFVRRKLDQEAAGDDDPPLTFWLAPVEARLRLRRYAVGGLSLGDTRCQRWWHPFKKEDERFSVDKDLAAKLSDEVGLAVDRLLAHARGECNKCRQAESGGHDE